MLWLFRWTGQELSYARRGCTAPVCIDLEDVVVLCFVFILVVLVVLELVALVPVELHGRRFAHVVQGRVEVLRVRQFRRGRDDAVSSSSSLLLLPFLVLQHSG